MPLPNRNVVVSYTGTTTIQYESVNIICDVMRSHCCLLEESDEEVFLTSPQKIDDKKETLTIFYKIYKMEKKLLLWKRDD